MPGFLRTADQYRDAQKLVALLGSKIERGVATESEVERYSAGVDHLLIYEWAEQGRWEREQLLDGKDYDELYAKPSWKKDPRNNGNRDPLHPGSSTVRNGHDPSLGVVAHLRRAAEQAAPPGSGNGVVAYLRLSPD